MWTFNWIIWLMGCVTPAADPLETAETSVPEEATDTGHTGLSFGDLFPDDTAPDDTAPTDPPEQEGNAQDGTYTVTAAEFVYFPELSVLTNLLGSLGNVNLPNRIRCTGHNVDITVDATAYPHISASYDCTGWQALGGSALTNLLAMPLLEESLVGTGTTTLTLEGFYDSADPQSCYGTLSWSSGGELATGSVAFTGTFLNDELSIGFDNTVLSLGVRGDFEGYR